MTGCDDIVEEIDTDGNVPYPTRGLRVTVSDGAWDEGGCSVFWVNETTGEFIQTETQYCNSDDNTASFEIPDYETLPGYDEGAVFIISLYDDPKDDEPAITIAPPPEKKSPPRILNLAWNDVSGGDAKANFINPLEVAWTQSCDFYASGSWCVRLLMHICDPDLDFTHPDSDVWKGRIRVLDAGGATFFEDAQFLDVSNGVPISQAHDDGIVLTNSANNDCVEGTGWAQVSIPLNLPRDLFDGTGSYEFAVNVDVTDVAGLSAGVGGIRLVVDYDEGTMPGPLTCAEGCSTGAGCVEEGVEHPYNECMVCCPDGTNSPFEVCQDAVYTPGFGWMSGWFSRTTGCDDGLACTENDECNLGTCMGDWLDRPNGPCDQCWEPYIEPGTAYCWNII